MTSNVGIDRPIDITRWVTIRCLDPKFFCAGWDRTWHDSICQYGLVFYIPFDILVTNRSRNVMEFLSSTSHQKCFINSNWTTAEHTIEDTEARSSETYLKNIYTRPRDNSLKGENLITSNAGLPSFNVFISDLIFPWNSDCPSNRINFLLLLSVSRHVLYSYSSVFFTNATCILYFVFCYFSAL